MTRKTYFRPLLRLIFVIFFVSIPTATSYAELTVESYCQLTIGIAREELDYLAELNALIQVYCDDPNFFQEYCNDPNCFLEQKLFMQAEFDSNEAALFEDFNTTAEEYDGFGDTDANAVEEYLKNNPAIAQTIDNLSRQIDELLKKLEIPSYCLLTIATAKQEMGNLSELIALAQQYSSDPNAFLEQERLKRAQSDQAKEVLFASFDTTGGEYVMFMGKTAKAVEMYLNDHPYIKQSINDLSGQLHTLLEEYEALRKSIIEVPAEEPPR